MLWSLQLLQRCIGPHILKVPTAKQYKNNSWYDCRSGCIMMFFVCCFNNVQKCLKNYSKPKFEKVSYADKQCLGRAKKRYIKGMEWWGESSPSYPWPRSSPRWRDCKKQIKVKSEIWSHMTMIGTALWGVTWLYTFKIISASSSCVVLCKGNSSTLATSKVWECELWLLLLTVLFRRRVILWRWGCRRHFADHQL